MFDQLIGLLIKKGRGFDLFLINFVFLLTLCLVGSNKILLLISIAYLIILILKLQNFYLSLFCLLVNLLPLIAWKNLLDVTLISKEALFGFAIFDIKYYWPLFFSDVFLVFFYQRYFTDKLAGRLSVQNLPKKFKQPLVFLGFFCLSTIVTSFNHQFSLLLLTANLQIIKYLLLFSLPFLINSNLDLLDRIKNTWTSLIASLTLFQSIVVIIEQLKGGNLGLYIENNLPGLEMGVASSEASDMLRANGTFNEPNITASFLVINLTFLLSTTFHQKEKPRSLWLFSICLISLVALVFTGSRSLYAIALLVLSYFFKQYNHLIIQRLKSILKNGKTKIILMVALLSLVFITSPYLIKRVASLSNVVSRDGSLNYRRELHRHILSISNQRWFGYGLKLTPYYLAKYFKNPYNNPVIFDPAPAHNIFIQLWAETGIIGLILFLLFLYSTFRNKSLKKNPYLLPSIVYLLAASFHPVFTNHYQLTAFFFLYLGFTQI